MSEAVIAWGGQMLASWAFNKLTEAIHLFPQNRGGRQPEDTVITFYAGQDTTFNDSVAQYNNPGGTTPKILLWDELGHFVGGTHETVYVPPGNPRPIAVRQRDDNRIIPSYLSLTAGSKNAICLAGMHISYPSEQGAALILGDAMVQLCHWQGYPSEARIKLDKGWHRPLCFWIDSDDSYSESWNEGQAWYPNQHKVYSMSLHLPDFEGTNDTLSAYNNGPQFLCNSDPRLQARPKFNGTVPIFKPALVYPGDNGRGEPTEHNATHVLNTANRKWSSSGEPCRTGVDGDDIKECYLTFKKWWHAGRKRAVAHGLSKGEIPELQSDHVEQDTEVSEPVTAPDRKTRMPFGEQLTISREEDRQFFATTVCQTPHFVGPHYVNLVEGLFCDMEDRTVWPLCDEARKHDCFDMADKSLLISPEVTNNVDGQLGDNSMGMQINPALPVVKKQMKRVREQT